MSLHTFNCVTCKRYNNVRCQQPGGRLLTFLKVHRVTLLVQISPSRLVVKPACTSVHRVTEGQLPNWGNRAIFSVS
jgi:hypothetical protein